VSPQEGAPGEHAGAADSLVALGSSFAADVLPAGRAEVCQVAPGILLKGDSMDEDLLAMSMEELVGEIRKLRQAIRAHRDSSLHELCWHQPELWGLLPEKTDPVPLVPEWPQFLEGCVKYRQSLDKEAPDAPRSRKPYEK
jgi:hypothetical protein